VDAWVVPVEGWRRPRPHTLLRLLLGFDWRLRLSLLLLNKLCGLCDQLGRLVDSCRRREHYLIAVLIEDLLEVRLNQRLFNSAGLEHPWVAEDVGHRDASDWFTREHEVEETLECVAEEAAGFVPLMP